MNAATRQQGHAEDPLQGGCGHLRGEPPPVPGAEHRRRRERGDGRPVQRGGRGETGDQRGHGVHRDDQQAGTDRRGHREGDHGDQRGDHQEPAADAGNRWIFPELAESGLRPWSGGRWVAVAGSNAPTHAVDATVGLERSVQSLLAHRSYIEGLMDEDPEAYCRTFLTGHAQAEGERFGGRPAVAFELFTR